MRCSPSLRGFLAVLTLFLAACSQEDKPTLGPVLAIGTDPNTGATIETNKDDYLPGEVVHVTGNGWSAGEIVNLHMTEDPDTHADVEMNVEADSTGSFSVHFYDVQEHDFGVTFTLVATGMTSGSSATAVFTDGIYQIAILSSPPGILPASIGYIIRNGCALSTGASTGTYTGTRVGVNATKVLVFKIPVVAGYTYSPPPTVSSGLTATTIGTDSLCVIGGSPSGPDQNKDITLNYNAANASLDIVKSSVGGTAEFDFVGSGAGGLDAGFVRNTATSNPTAIAPFTITTFGDKYIEESTEPGWTLTNIECTAGGATYLIGTGTGGSFDEGANDGFDPGENVVKVTIAAGNTPSCTFTNTKNPTLDIEKSAVGGTAEFDFVGAGGGGLPASFTRNTSPTNPTETAAFELTTLGEKFVEETVEDGWTLTNISCDAGNAEYLIGTGTGASFDEGTNDGFDPGENVVKFTVGAGDTPSCTFTNTKGGSITIVKEALPVDHAQSFTFSASGSGMTPSPFELVDDGDVDVPLDRTTFSGLLPDATPRTITEPGETGWEITNIVCTGATASTILVGNNDDEFQDGESSVSVTLAAGENVTCTFTNTNLPPELAAINDIVNHPEETQATFTASATDIDPVTYSIDNCAAGNYPTGASIGSSSGVFTWTPGEDQGAATYCVKVIATAIGGTDFDEVSIGVTEVNKAPVLTVPTSFSIKWGVALSGVNASATDPDLAAPPPGTALNNLTMSLTTFPTGMTINTTPGTSGLSRAISWTPAITDVGANTVTVKVTDDGTPTMEDSESFTITVLAHATTLTYDGATSGQYSDVSQLCATLTDDDASNAPIPGKTVTFYWDGGSVGPGTTNASGKACTDLATNVYTVLNPNGDSDDHKVKAVFAAGGGYLGDETGDVNFDVDAEDASVTPDAANENAYQVGAPGGTANFTLKFAVQEKSGPEPDQNDKALAGNIANAVLAVSLTPIGGGAITSTCTSAVVGSGYAGIKTYTCPFTAVPVETYELKADLDGTYYAGSYSDVVTVQDPSLGFVTGGGKYMVQNADLSYDRVNFGFVAKIVQNKKSSNVKGSLLVIRHKSNGDVARIKSNVFDGLSITSTATEKSATFSGKANYSVNGVTDPTNYDFNAYVLDGGTSGAGVDKFSLYHGKSNAAAGYEVRTSPTFAALKALTSVKTLTGGNIQVPQGAK